MFEDPVENMSKEVAELHEERHAGRRTCFDDGDGRRWQDRGRDRRTAEIPRGDEIYRLCVEGSIAVHADACGGLLRMDLHVERTGGGGGREVNRGFSHAVERLLNMRAYGRAAFVDIPAGIAAARSGNRNII